MAEEQKAELNKQRLYLKWDVSDDKLRAIFEKFGKVSEARVVRGPRVRGSFGFVAFENEADAGKALAAWNGKDLPVPLSLEYSVKERKPRQQRERKPKAEKAEKPAAAAGGAAADAEGGRKRRQRKPAGERKEGDKPAREERPKDPNWGKLVRLIPDPIATPVAKNAQLTELKAGQRTYRAGRTEGKVIGALALNADPTKGPFNCDFKLGNFELKLLQVKVNSKPDDVRVGCRVSHPASGKSREVYFRARKGQPNAHKFLELKGDKPEDANAAEYTAYLVAIDSITFDAASGLWTKLQLSLNEVVLPRRQRKEAAGAQ